MRRFLIIFLLVILFAIANQVNAEIKTFVREYTYRASDIDSKVTSRTIALEQVKRILMEELGSYLTSETQVKDFQLTKDQITAYSAGIVSIEIMEEKWDGGTFYLKAKVSANPDDFIKSLKELVSSKRETGLLDDVRKQAVELSKEIEKLKKDMELTKSSTQSVSQYNDIVKKLSANDWYERGLSLGRSGDRKGALEAHTKAIELNPQYKEAYSMRALIYAGLGENEKATENFQSAARYGDERAQKLLKIKGIGW